MKSKLILLLSIIVIVQCGLDETRVILVDTYQNNLLFRCNNPVSNNKFQYEELVQYMKTKAEAAGVPFPTDFELIDFSLLNPVSDLNIQQVESLYFKLHPSKGKYHNYPILGSLIYPNSLNEKLRTSLAKSYDFVSYDQLHIINSQIQQALQNISSNKPQIVFFHCMAGEDRTGEVFGGYKMQFHNWSYRNALIFDNHVETRQIEKMSRNGMNAYCWYLEIVKGYEGLQCDYEYNPDDQIDNQLINQ